MTEAGGAATEDVAAPPPAAARADARAAWRAAAWLFAAGLAVRLLFWLGMPDRDHAWSVAFEGDAPVWQIESSAAAAVAAAGGGEAAAGAFGDELLLPFRPPGMGFLAAALWDGDPSSAWRVRLAFVLLGSLVAPVLYFVLRGPYGHRVAVAAGFVCALATNLVLLGSGPQVELPYLLLFLFAMADQERLRRAPAADGGLGLLVAARWGLLHALLCLLRAEHTLVFAALLGCLLWQRRAGRWRIAACAVAAFGAGLVPWHVHAWRQVDAYNASGAGAAPPPGLPWDEDAVARVHALPGFQQDLLFSFVAETVRVRGGNRVRAADLEIVREAYGCWPEPLPRPFLALYGGLNFFLANTPEANGGFSRAALDRPPPLAGDAARYPSGPRWELPRGGKLALLYPPHLDAVVHGYALGLRELAADPAGALARLGKKLAHAAEGAATGFGGANLPMGLSGTRRAVDFVTANGAWAWTWRLALLAAAAWGSFAARKNPATAAWLAGAGARVVAVLGWFGYARQGALLLPVVALGLAVAWTRVAPASPRRRMLIGALALTAVLAADVVRAAVIDEVRLDGAPWRPGDPSVPIDVELEYATR